MVQVFALLEVGVLEANIRKGPDGRTADRFLVNPGDQRFMNPRFVEHFRDAMRILV